MDEYIVKSAFRCKNSDVHYHKDSSYPCDDPKRVTELQEFGLIGDRAHVPPNTDTDTEGVKHVGGGYFELPNGEKIKGKDSALQKLAELQTSAPPVE